MSFELPHDRPLHRTGRGAQIDPANRFERIHIEDDYEQLEHEDEFFAALAHPETQYLIDESQSIVAENDSPDVGFRYSINPYRGCSHGCAYCYARPSHEYLGMSAGLDFETKILVKLKAAELFRDFLCRPAWQAETIVMSGVTDCYQPAERKFRLTRHCLEVALEARQPIGIITKNALVARDLDLLSEMAAQGLVHVNFSITTLDGELARTMEPRTSTPPAKLRAMRTLADAGVPLRVMVAPVIPGLTDSEMPSILAAAAEAGAQSAGYVLLRLPWTVQPIFLDWLKRHRPLSSERIENLIRATRGGQLYRSKWRERHLGTGEFADQIAQMFRAFTRKYGLDGGLPPLVGDRFQPPRASNGQLRLF